MPSAKLTIPFGLLIIIIAMLSAFAPLATDMYLPALTQMAQSFNSTHGHAQATISLFFLGLALGQAFYGPLADRFGRKPILLIGIGIFIAATIGCIFAPTVEALIVLRVAQAFGGAAGMLIGRAIISDLFDRTEMARILSLMMMVMVLAPILAPIIGGWMITHSSWHSIFVVLLVFAILCAVLVSIFIPETLAPERRQPLSVAGTLRTYGQLLSNPHFIIPALSGALVQGGMFAYITGSEFVFTHLYGLSEQQFSWVFACNAIGIILGNNGNRFLLKRMPLERIFSYALATVGILTLVFVLLANAKSMWIFILPLWLIIASMGFVGANAVAIAMSNSGRNAGSGSGLVGVLQFGLAFTLSSIVATSQNGTAYPMVITMSATALLGCTLWFATARLRQRTALADH